LEVTCTGCSLLCEDIKIIVENGRIVKDFGSCIVGNEKLRMAFSPERFKEYLAVEDGSLKRLSGDEMAEKVAEMLKSSRKPLLYGWCNSTCEAISLGLKLAGKLNAYFDGPLSLYYGYAIMAAREKGFYKTTLDDVRENADHIIFWGANPAETFHRHMSKFSVFPRGLKAERGVESRILTVVDVRKTRTVAHNRLILQPGEDAALMEALTYMVETGQYPGESKLSLPLRRIASLVRDLKNSSFVAIFYGLGLLGSGKAEENLSALHRLTDALEKAGVRCVAMPLPGHYNSLGFIETCLKETGHPYALNFTPSGVKHSPAETSVVPILVKGEADAALIVSSNPLASLPFKAAQTLASLPFAALDYVETLTVKHAKYRVPVAISGLETGGTALRLDGVEMKLNPAVEPPEGILSDEEFLRKVYENL